MGKRILIVSAILLTGGIGYWVIPLLTVDILMMIAIAAGIIGVMIGLMLNQAAKNDSQ